LPNQIKCPFCKEVIYEEPPPLSEKLMTLLTMLFISFVILMSLLFLGRLCVIGYLLPVGKFL